MGNYKYGAEPKHEIPICIRGYVQLSEGFHKGLENPK